MNTHKSSSSLENRVSDKNVEGVKTYFEEVFKFSIGLGLACLLDPLVAAMERPMTLKMVPRARYSFLTVRPAITLQVHPTRSRQSSIQEVRGMSMVSQVTSTG